MKTPISFLLVAFSFTLMAQDITDSDNRLIDGFLSSITSITREKISSEDLEKVFNGSFYLITPMYVLEHASTTCGEYRIVIHEDQLSVLEDTGEDKPLNMMFSLVRDDFRMNGENDALTFEKALDALYPLSWADKEKDKKHYQRDNSWVFTRGEFFDSLKGFIVEVDGQNRITAVRYDLNAEE